MSSQASTMREIDLTLARALRRVRALAQTVNQQKIVVRAHPRTRIPGPNTYKRMSTGQLAMAALAGAALYDWSRQEQDIFETELENRGLDESLDIWRDDSYDLAGDDEGIALERFDQLSQSLSVLTVNGLENLASAVDEVILGGDGRVPGALPPAEVIEDMQVTGADPDAIAAYEAGVGTSSMSPSDEIEMQGLQPPTREHVTALAPTVEQELTF